MVNEWVGIGRLGANPEVRYDKKGGAIVNFNLATNHAFKNKAGEKVDKTSWHKCVGFGKTAEICGSYLKKGSLVFIKARVDYHQWKDKNEVERWSTEMIIERMQMLDRKGEVKPDDDKPITPDDVPYDDDVPY